eukprot:scaffold570_cov382-Prasinococcus_capsulatus_cf.AAC.14
MMVMMMGPRTAGEITSDAPRCASPPSSTRILGGRLGSYLGSGCDKTPTRALPSSEAMTRPCTVGPRPVGGPQIRLDQDLVAMIAHPCRCRSRVLLRVAGRPLARVRTRRGPIQIYTCT